MTAIADTNQAVRATIVFCLLATLCEGIDLQAAGVAAAGIIPEFKPGANQLGNFFGASTLGLFFGALIGGRLADSIGRKRVLVTSIALFGVFSLLTPLAWDMASLSLARLLTGLGLGGALPNVIALVAECSRDNRRNAAVAMVYSGLPFGGALISLISMLLAATHWRFIFVAGGVAPLVLAPIMALGMPESAAFRRVQIDNPAAVSVDGATSARRGSFIAIFTEGRATGTLLLWVSFLLALLTLYLLLNWLPTLLIGDGLSREQAAVAQIGFTAGGGLAAIVMGYLLESRWRGATVVVTFVSLPILLVTLARASAELQVVGVIVTLLGCAVLASQAFLYAMAPSRYPTVIRGVGVGAAVAVGRIGSIAGPKLGGLLKAAGHGSSQLLMDLLPIVILGSVCALLLAGLRPKAACKAVPQAKP